MASRGPAVPTHLPPGLPPTQCMAEQVCYCNMPYRLTCLTPYS